MHGAEPDKLAAASFHITFRLLSTWTTANQDPPETTVRSFRARVFTAPTTSCRFVENRLRMWLGLANGYRLSILQQEGNHENTV